MRCPMCGVDCGCGCKLPYDFDLMLDVKTFEKLRYTYVSAKSKMESVETLCQAYGVDLEVLLENNYES